MLTAVRDWWWRRTSNSVVWCKHWYAHPEAEKRLEALWRAFEKVTIEADYMGCLQWFQHFDYEMGVLTDPAGPFAECQKEAGHVDPVEAKITIVRAPTCWYEFQRAELEKYYNTHSSPQATQVESTHTDTTESTDSGEQAQ